VKYRVYCFAVLIRQLLRHVFVACRLVSVAGVTPLLTAVLHTNTNTNGKVKSFPRA